MEDSPRISGQCLCWAGHIGLPWGPQEDGTGSRTPGPRRLILREVSSSTSLACDQQACPFPHHQAFPPRRESALCLGRDPHTSLIANVPRARKEGIPQPGSKEPGPSEPVPVSAAAPCAWGRVSGEGGFVSIIICGLCLLPVCV